MRNKNGDRFMIYISPAVRESAGKLAKERYDIEFSPLVQRLLEKEMSLKRGLVHPRYGSKAKKGGK